MNRHTEKLIMEGNKILQGDALIRLKELPTESIDCVVTSPPYWSLRDYGVDGQLGLEPTFQEYINKLCNIFDEEKYYYSYSYSCNLCFWLLDFSLRPHESRRPPRLIF